MKAAGVFRGEDGFTLIEALVAMLVMVTVMFALYAIFDAGVRILRFGNDKAEAVESARIGMERMERELRAAYPFSRTSGGGEVLFPSFGPNPSESISFGNDFNGNGAIAGSSEMVSYRLDYDDDGTPSVFRATGIGKGVSLARPAAPDGLTFTYLDEDGKRTFEEKNVAAVRIELTISVKGRAQTLTTDVALRNRAD